MLPTIHMDEVLVGENGNSMMGPVTSPDLYFHVYLVLRTFTNVTFDKYIMDTCAHTCTETWNITVFVL